MNTVATVVKKGEQTPFKKGFVKIDPVRTNWYSFTVSGKKLKVLNLLLMSPPYIKDETHEFLQNDVPYPVIVCDPGVLLCEIDSIIVSDSVDSALLFKKNLKTNMCHKIYKCLVAWETYVKPESEFAKISWPPFGITIEDQVLNVGKELSGGGLKEKVKEF